MAGELRGWKEIAAYLGVTDRTAQRWEAELKLPVHRLRQHGSSGVYACPQELDSWRLSADGERADAERADAERSAAANRADNQTTVDREPPGPTGTATAASAPPPQRRRFVVAMAAAGVLVAAAIAIFFATRHGAPQKPATTTTSDRPAAAGASSVRASADSPYVITLRITMADGTPFRARSVNGELIFVTQASGARYGLLPAQMDTSVRLAVTLSTRGGRGIKVIQTLLLERAIPLLFSRGDDSFRVEWIASEPAPAKEVARTGEQRSRCGMVCGQNAVDALQVSSPCGSCCDPDFLACSQVAHRRP